MSALVCGLDVQDGTVTLILSNPPFAGREKDPHILRQFKLGVNKDGKPISVSKEILFIEKIIRLLAKDGRAGLVLPSGIFNNPSLKRVRDHIKANVKILAIVGLPHLSFQVTGANNEGHLLFIQKVEKIPEDYPIFIDRATHVGIDAIGRQTGQSDLSTIVERFRSPPHQNTIMFSELKDRVDPWHYHPNYLRLKKSLEKTGHPWESLGGIFQQSEDLFNRSEWRAKPIKYIEKGDVDMETGTIRSFTEHTFETLPTWAHWILREGDVLFPRAYDSMRGVAVVPKEYEGLVCTGGLIVVRHNPDKIRLPYVRYHFTRPEILALIKQFETGEINPKYTWTGLSTVRVPLPGLEEQDRILREIAEVEKKRELVLKTMKDLEGEIDAKIRRAIPRLITNYENIKIKRAEFIGEAEINETT
jgi:type I restriction enzyme M protein